MRASKLSGSLAYPETSEYDSYAAENLAQTEALLDFVEQTATSERRFVMGDFNHGPARGSYDAELPESYARIIDAGWSDPVADLGRCTFCESNLLLGGAGEGGEIIDHIYLDPGTAAEATAEIIFDDPVDIVTAAGDPRSVHLSDHFGVAVELAAR